MRLYIGILISVLGLSSCQESAKQNTEEKEVAVDTEVVEEKEAQLDLQTNEVAVMQPINSSQPIESTETSEVSTEMTEQSLPDDYLVTGWYLINEESTMIERELSKSVDRYPIQPEPILTRKDFSSVQMYQTYAGPDVVMGVSMILRPNAKKKYAEVTKNNRGNAIAFILNNELVYIGRIYGEVGTGIATITRMDYTPEEVFKLQEDINNSK